MPTIVRFGIGSQVYAFPDTSVLQQSMSDNFANAVPRTTRLPGLQGGFDEFGDEEAPAEIGKVTLDLNLFADARSDMTALLDALRAMKSWGKKRLYMQLDDSGEDVRWCNARINHIQSPSDLKTLGVHHHVKVIWQAPDPYWYTQGTEAWSWGDGTAWGEGAPWGGSATPQAVSGLQTDLTITPGGNARTLPRITIECGTGQTLQNPTIQRIVDGVALDEISYTGTLSAGDQLLINCRKASVALNGVAAYDDFTFNHPDFIRLYPGSNTLRVRLANAGDAGSVTVRYYEAYL